MEGVTDDTFLYNRHMRLSSPGFTPDALIPVRYTCDGINISPPLRWDEVPEDAQSFALVVKDVDAPGEWIHWLVCNIPVKSRLIPEGGPVPRGSREVRNDFGRQAYGGPCPNTGEHRYSFTLYALNVEHLPTRIRKENFIELCRQHAIDKVVLIARYRAGGPVSI